MNEDLNFYLTFSGCRGYHIYLSLAKKYNREDFRSFYHYLKESLKLKYIDSHCSQDIRRLMRIPNTINMKSGLLCSLINYYERGENLQIEKYASSNESISEFPLEKVSKEFCLIQDYPCLDKAIKDENASNFIRFAYTAKELRKGKSRLEIFKYLSSLNWNDFSPKKTKYHISYLSRKNFKPPSCWNIRKKGYCLESCKHRCENKRITLE